MTVSIDAETARMLRERANAHRVSQAAYVRAAIAGARPGGAPGQPAAAADRWWDSQGPSRRAQVHRWLTARTSNDTDEHPADQLMIFEEGINA